MGKNKSKHRIRTDYATRVSAMRKIDNEAKQPGHKANGGGNGKRDRGEAES